MKVNITKTIDSYDGKKFTDDNDQPVTLRKLCDLSLNTLSDDEQKDDQIKHKIYDLSLKIYSGDMIDLSLDERAFIKERAGRVLLPLTYGRLCDALEEGK